MYRLIYFLICFAQVGSLFAQNKLEETHTITARNQSIESILHALESEELKFTYSSDVFDVKKRVSISKSDANLNDVLKTLFNGQNVEFIQMGDQIIIRKKRAIPEPEEMVQEDQVQLKDTVAVAVPIQSNVTLESEPQVPAKIENEDKGQGGSFSNYNGSETDGGNDIEELSVSEVHKGRPEFHFQQHVYPSYVRFNKYQYITPVDYLEPKRQDPPAANGRRYAGGFYAAMTSIDEDAGILIGGRFLYFLTTNFGVGIGGGGFISPIYQDQTLGGDYRVTGGYGGLFAEYSFRPMRMIHLNYHVLVGGGGTVYIQETDIPFGLPMEDNEPMFVVEPGITLEMNVVSFLRIGLDATYRYTSSGSLQYQSNGETIITTQSLRGVNLGVSLRFGRF